MGEEGGKEHQLLARAREGEALTCSRANVHDFDMDKLYFLEKIHINHSILGWSVTKSVNVCTAAVVAGDDTSLAGRAEPL